MSALRCISRRTATHQGWHGFARFVLHSAHGLLSSAHKLHVIWTANVVALASCIAVCRVSGESWSEAGGPVSYEDGDCCAIPL